MQTQKLSLGLEAYGSTTFSSGKKEAIENQPTSSLQDVTNYFNYGVGIKFQYNIKTKKDE